MVYVRYVSYSCGQLLLITNQLLVSITRAIGPAEPNSLLSLSIEKGYLRGQLVYYVLVVISGVTLALGTMLPQQIWTD